MEYTRFHLKKVPRVRCAIVFKPEFNHRVIRTETCEICMFPNYEPPCGRLRESEEKGQSQVDLYYNGEYKQTWPRSLAVQITVTDCIKFGIHDGRIFYDPSSKTYKGVVTAAYEVFTEVGSTIESYNFNIELIDGFTTNVEFEYGGITYELSSMEIFDCETPHFKYYPVEALDICGIATSTIALEIQT